jgi:uncharacterized protein
VNATDQPGRTPIGEALRFRQSAVAGLLLDMGAPREATVQHLEEAALRGYTDVLALLLKHGADPDHTGARGVTLLQDAALKGHLAAVDLLLKAGADPARPGRQRIVSAARCRVGRAPGGSRPVDRGGCAG